MSVTTRSLIVQPRPFTLGPGVNRATIDLADAVHPPKHVNVALAVLASSGAPRRPSDAERALLARWIACGAP